MVHRFKSTLSHLLRVHTGRRQLSDQSNWLTKIGLSKQTGPFEPTRQSERLVDATARLRLIREARRRPPDEQLFEWRTGLDDRAVVAPRECPILESLTSSAALFDHTRRWQTAAQRCRRGLARLRREPVSDRPPCSAQAELEAPCSNSSPMLDRRTSPPVPRCVPDPRAGRTRISLLSDAQHRALQAEPLR